jgi:hypothetical protein
VDASDLLVYQSSCADRTAITDPVGALLTPLQRSGGAGPKLATLQEYYEVAGWRPRPPGGDPSVRAVTYRLARVKELTGRDRPGAGLAPGGGHWRADARLARRAA